MDVNYYQPMPVQPVAPQKHSGLGIASFIISLSNGFALMILIVIAGVMEASTPGGIDEESPQVVILGLFILFSCFVGLVGLALGLAGLCMKNRKKLFAVLGTVFTLVMVLLILALAAIGAAAA